MNTIPIESRLFALMNDKKLTTETVVNTNPAAPQLRSNTLDMAKLLDIVKTMANETTQEDDKLLLKKQILENRYVVQLDDLTNQLFQTLSFERSL